MDFVVVGVGAGAVGCVVGTLLEADGHRVRYLARPSQRAESSEIRVDRVGGPSVRSPSPQYLDRDVVERRGGACPLAVAAISLDSVVERARSAGLTGTVLAYHVSFGSFRDPRHRAADTIAQGSVLRAG
jgi:hypothetical protein